LLAFGALTQKLVLLVPFHWAWGVELEWGERGFRVLSAIAVYFISGFLYNDQVDYLQLLQVLSKRVFVNMRLCNPLTLFLADKSKIITSQHQNPNKNPWMRRPEVHLYACLYETRLFICIL